MDRECFKTKIVIPALQALPDADVMGKSEARCIKVWTKHAPGVNGTTIPITRWYCTDEKCLTRRDNKPLVAMTCAGLDRPGDSLYNKCPVTGTRNELWPTEDEPQTTIYGTNTNDWSWDPPFFPEENHYYNCFDFYETGPDNREIPRTQFYTRSIGIGNLLNETGAQTGRRDVYADFHGREYALYTQPDVCTSLKTYDMCRTRSLGNTCLFVKDDSRTSDGKCVSVNSVRPQTQLCSYIDQNVSDDKGMKKETCESYWCVYDDTTSTCRDGF